MTRDCRHFLCVVTNIFSSCHHQTLTFDALAINRLSDHHGEIDIR